MVGRQSMHVAMITSCVMTTEHVIAHTCFPLDFAPSEALETQVRLLAADLQIHIQPNKLLHTDSGQTLNTCSNITFAEFWNARLQHKAQICSLTVF